MPWTYEPEALATFLQEAGFDAMIFDNVQGVLDDGGVNRQVYINSSGQIRYQLSQVVSESAALAQISGTEVRVERQNRDINNLYGRLDSTERLVDFLREAPILLRKDETR